MKTGILALAAVVASLGLVAQPSLADHKKHHKTKKHMNPAKMDNQKASGGAKGTSGYVNHSSKNVNGYFNGTSKKINRGIQKTFGLDKKKK